MSYAFVMSAIIVEFRAETSLARESIMKEKGSFGEFNPLILKYNDIRYHTPERLRQGDIHMKNGEPAGALSPCGLNCDWCVYHKMEEVTGSGCPGCFEREKCQIRDCACEEGRGMCDGCDSHPCSTFLQGYECMKEHHVF
jgi:hypothetical protein